MQFYPNMVVYIFYLLTSLPKGSNMHYSTIRHLLKFIAWLLMLNPYAVSAQVDCSTLPHWVTLENGLRLNQYHIFCGEWHNNRPKGFHSRPEGINPATVSHFIVQSQANAAGIYTGRWSHQSNPSKNKFSSMFPDNCTITQILNSISHATATSASNCPSGSPDWIQCGFNKPATTPEQEIHYCSKDGNFFTIGFAPARQGKIDTAFPIFE